eukprot:scaffold23640_cov132-Isochrysis_galbana.AAC.10
MISYTKIAEQSVHQQTARRQLPPAPPPTPTLRGTPAIGGSQNRAGTKPGAGIDSNIARPCSQQSLH